MKLWMTLLGLLLGTSLFAQDKHKETLEHTHHFDVHCSACKTVLGGMSFAEKGGESFQFFVDKSAVKIGEEEQYLCAVCSQHVFSKADISTLVLDDSFVFSRPQEASTVTFRINEQQQVNLKNFCPTCHQKLTTQYNNGLGNTHLKLSEIKGLFK